MGQPFATSFACMSAIHCGTCRALESGRAWRVSLGKVFELPPRAPDFDCPLGKPWGWTPPAGQGVEAQLEARRPAHESPGVQAHDAELEMWAECDECGHQLWPSGSARGCKLIEDGKPCALGKRVQDNGPWPDVCPRNTQLKGDPRAR